MTSGMLAPKNCLIGKTVATSKVLFIAPICLRSHFGDRPFLAGMAGMAVTSRGCCWWVGRGGLRKRCDWKIYCDRQSLFYRSNWPE
jgi:hypothetical protein